MAEGEEEGGLQPGLSSEGLRQAGEAKGKGVQTPDSRLLRLVQQKRQVGRQQGTFRLATNDRPTVSILSLLPKRKETKGEKTKKRGKEFCKNVVLFLTLLGVESETLIISKR
ncbi:unnamed protein product [Sphagnum jensenii]|uniref:Uncharacterized protein n=1 Tax=Sphagnum jensenii TaxID=128206 RepID=A0ABP0VKY5_9BRYO